MIADKLKPYQREAAERIARSGSMLLADQPGLGKTYTSLGALEISGALKPGFAAIIAGPVITCDSAWANTIITNMPEVNLINAYTGSRAKRNKSIVENFRNDVPNIIVTNHESLGIAKNSTPALPELHAVPVSAILIDESHAVLPMDYDYPNQATQFWRGLFALNDRCSDDVLRLAISGTPDRGKLHYRFGTWRFLLPKALAPSRIKYEDWLKKNFYTYQMTVPVKRKGGQPFDATITKVGHMLNHITWARIDRTLMIRRTKREVAQQLPDKQYVDVDIPFSDKLLDSYQEFTNEFVKEDDGSTGNALVFALRAMQFATCEWEFRGEKLFPIVDGESPKRDWLIHWLKERNLQRDAEELPITQVVITSQYTRVLNWLKEELNVHGITAEILSGDTSQPERKRIQEAFQDETNPLRVVLLSSTLGVGIDLDAADDLIFVDIPRNPDIQEQVEDRVHRVSRIHQVTIWRLRSRGTIDFAVSAKNDETFQKTRSLMDGVRSVDFERNILARIGVR
jgi:SNF2 family DNA or RNA helicase